MEVEHMIAKELILGHEQYEKLDNNNGLHIPELQPFSKGYVITLGNSSRLHLEDAW